MLPQSRYNLENNFIIQEQPSLTYRMNLQKGKIVNHCDNLEAIVQAAYKMLSTERYDCLIYSWNYGVELKDLFGMPMSYCIPEIERRVREALMQDTRIKNVTDFVFEIPKKGTILVSFLIETVKGSTRMEKEVNI